MARIQRDSFKAQAVEAKALHGESVLKYAAEDWLYRKRYRTLKAKHGRWVADFKATKDKSIAKDRDLLDILAEAAAWDAEAKVTSDAERAAAKSAAAACAAVAAETKLRDAEIKETAAATLLSEALLREAAAKKAQAAVAANEVATAATLDSARELEGMAAAASASATAQERAAAASKKPPVLRFTDAVVGSEAHMAWRSRQRNAIIEFMISLFGVGWHEEFGGDAARNGIVFKDPHNGRSTKPSDVVEILDSFFKIYQDLFDKIGEPTRRRGRNIAKATESGAVRVVQEHMDKVVIALHAECSLTDHAYQCLINYTSNVYEDNQMSRLLLPFDTPMAKWMPKNKLKEALKEATIKLGIEVKPGSAWLDPIKVVTQRVIELIRKGLITIQPGMILKVQLLGDATTLWKSMKVNGTTIVLKVIYNDKKDGKKLKGDGVNTVENQKAIGFYLGDDTHALIKLNAPDLPKQLLKLCIDGIIIDGERVGIRLLLGGDLKFINSLLGLKNNASMYPCPFCITHKDLLHCSLAILRLHQAQYEREVASRKASLPGLAGSSRGRGRGARGRGSRGMPKPPITHLGPRTNEMQN